MPCSALLEEVQAQGVDNYQLCLLVSSHWAEEQYTHRTTGYCMAEEQALGADSQMPMAPQLILSPVCSPLRGCRPESGSAGPADSTIPSHLLPAAFWWPFLTGRWYWKSRGPAGATRKTPRRAGLTANCTRL